MPFLANGLAVWILAFLMVGFLIGAIIAFSNAVSERDSVAGYVLTGALFILALASLGGWSYATTHRLVPINEKWLVIDTSTGKIDGGIRSAGLITKPFLMYQINRYPAMAERPTCIDYKPSFQEGEILAHVCFTYDASQIDWAKQFTEHGFANEVDVVNYWANQSKESISAAVSGVDYTQATFKRPEVSEKIRKELTSYFNNINVSVSNIHLENWDYTSADVRAFVNQAASASMKTTVEKQLLESAKVARERQLYEIETTNQVLAKRGTGLNDLMTKMGITSEEQKVYFATQMNWYNLASNPPAGMQVILGMGGNPIIAQTNPLPAPTVVVPTATPTK